MTTAESSLPASSENPSGPALAAASTALRRSLRVHCGMWAKKFPAASIRGYNWFFLPLGFLLQKPLRLAEGLIDLAGVHEILLVCRRGASPAAC